MAECIWCQKRPTWKPHSRYLCQTCYEEVMDARLRCPCPCHQTNSTPARCCTERHDVICPSLVHSCDGGQTDG